MNTWEDRIKARMKDLDLTQEELAHKLGVTRGAVTHYLAGRRVPPLRQFQKLAAILKADPAWLQFGTTNKIGAVKVLPTSGGIKNIKKIPILSLHGISELTNVAKLEKNEIKEHLQHIFTNQPHWYALRVKGDFMSAPTGTGKSFCDSDIIIVDPDAEAKHSSYVVALLPKSKEATFKQLVIDGGIRYLKPLNPQYPTIHIEQSTYICGVAVISISTL